MQKMDGWDFQCTDYDVDIVETLKERESLRKMVTIRSSELHRRNSVVELIRNIAEQHSFQRSSVHLAIYMLDLFMTEHLIEEERLNLVALTCFYVACKIEENELTIPSLIRLCSFLGNSYTPGDVRALEVHILNFFEWQVTIPTAATFLDFFTLHCLQMEDFIIPAGIDFTEADFAEFKNDVIRSSLVYLDVSLLCHKMGNVKPSLLAAACVAAARCITSNVRAWSNHLTSVTGYSFQQIYGLCCIMAFELSPLDVQSITDSGYISEPEDTDDSNVNKDNESSQDVHSTSNTKLCLSVKRKRNRYTSSSSSSSDSEESCAKRQRVKNQLM